MTQAAHKSGRVLAAARGRPRRRRQEENRETEGPPDPLVYDWVTFIGGHPLAQYLGYSFFSVLSWNFAGVHGAGLRLELGCAAAAEFERERSVAGSITPALARFRRRTQRGSTSHAASELHAAAELLRKESESKDTVGVQGGVERGGRGGSGRWIHGTTAQPVGATAPRGATAPCGATTPRGATAPCGATTPRGATAQPSAEPLQRSPHRPQFFEEEDFQGRRSAPNGTGGSCPGA